MRASLLAIALAACGGGKSAMNDAGGDAPNPDANTGSYAAFSVLGGLDRIVIVKSTPSTCFGIVLRNPGTGNGGGMTVPANWDFESAFARQPAGACAPGFAGPILNTFDSTSRSGTIAWTTDPPQTITSMQATLVFANNPAWCPPSELLTTTNLAVQQ